MSRPTDSLPVLILCSLVASGGLACADTGTADLTAGASTGEQPTTAELPTSGTGADAPTPTTSATISDTTGTSGQPDPTDTDSTDTVSTDTDATDTDSSDAPPSCGDGVVDPGEQCDDGLAGNDDTHFCTTDCTLNVCGDGKLFLGWELCDEGRANSNMYGNICNTICEPGERCGDNKLQPAFETCDLGPDNGSPTGDDQGIRCDAACNAQRLRGFVTSDAFNSTGDLDGLYGADLLCRGAAQAAGLPEPERFHALLSTGTVEAKTRFAAVDPDLPYVFVTGKKFADNLQTLLAAGPLGEGLVATETGAAIYQRKVVTNTAPGGGRYSPDQHCQDWTTANPAHKARVGLNAVPLDAPEYSDWKTMKAWLGAASRACDSNDFHLYCLEI